MDNNTENLNASDPKWRLLAYSALINTAAETRKANISVINLCKKLDTSRSVIYRMESGAIDVKLSTLINYLHGFDYHLEIVPDNKNMTDLKSDMIADINGVQIPIEYYEKNKLDNRARIRLLKLLIEQMEDEFGSDDDE